MFGCLCQIVCLVWTCCDSLRECCSICAARMPTSSSCVSRAHDIRPLYRTYSQQQLPVYISLTSGIWRASQPSQSIQQFYSISSARCAEFHVNLMSSHCHSASSTEPNRFISGQCETACSQPSDDAFLRQQDAQDETQFALCSVYGLGCIVCDYTSGQSMQH